MITSIESTDKKRKNCRFTDNERYLIGKYVAIHGPIATVKKFKRSHPRLKFGESTARSFREKYHDKIKSSDISSIIKKKQVGRPFVLGAIDQKVQNFLAILRRKGGVMNTVVANPTAQALIDQSEDEHLKNIDLGSSSWVKNLFHRMGFVKRTCTTSKPEIPEKAKMEAKLLYQYQIVSYVEEYSIPPWLILNFDQTPLKFAPVTNRTLSAKGSTHVAITGSSFKQALTATFGITCANKFLLMELICRVKMERSIPRVKFHNSFSLSANEKHFSNMLESLKLLDEIVTPYIEKECANLQLRNDQPALLMIDVFSRQMTGPVIEKIRENSIELVKVPANMTQLFQPLDLTVNGSAKAFMKRKFTKWYSSFISAQLAEGKEIEDVEVPLKLPVLKPLHAKWVIDLFNHFISKKGRKIQMVGKPHVSAKPFLKVH